MNRKIKESVGTLLAHIIKVDHRDVEKEAPLFCDLMGENFECDPQEAKTFLRDIMKREYDLDEHIAIINQALCEDKLSKYHLMEQLNHIIYSDKISPEDYKIFEDIKNKLFEC
ncbi:TerB family tellurite resistance protein [Sulfurovum sp.]|uniref:TerB family tellurite resistance protein n=1 Tax=Sulfurovum sp. TaxID=1969726 RepID=UPI0025FFB2AE|nr:TerB family tellurite resistance protein [Sulfurovum sp.]